MRKELKTFIGGSIIFGIVGLLVGGFVIAAVLGTAFIKYTETHPTICQPMNQITNIK